MKRSLQLLQILILLAIVAVSALATVTVFAQGGAFDPSMSMALETATPASSAADDAAVLPQVPHSLLAQILTAALPLFLAGLAWLGKRVDAWLAAKTENQLLEGFLVWLDHLVFSAVKELAQTLVPEYQKKTVDGKLTKAEAAELKRLAIATVKKRLGALGLAKAAKLGFAESALEDLIGGRVEAAVHDLKRAAASAPYLNGKVAAAGG